MKSCQCEVHTFLFFPKVIFLTNSSSCVRHRLLHFILGNTNKINQWLSPNRGNRYKPDSCMYCRCEAQAENIHNEANISPTETWKVRWGQLKCLRRHLKYLWQRTLGSRSLEMWRLLVYWMGTKASWVTAASFFSVRQDVEDICLLHYIQQPHLKRPTSAIFVTVFLGNSYGNFLFIYRCHLQLTVHSETWCQCICPSAGTCGLHNLYRFRDRRTRQNVAP